MVINVSQWSAIVADRLYNESTALTHANPDTLVHVLGSIPNPVVRKRLADRQKELDRRYETDVNREVAVVTDNAAMRGAVTALGWITGGHLRGFSSTRVDDGAAWLRTESHKAQKIVEMYQECQRLIREVAATP
ncbi:MAG: STAS/SEC14 domain-containing protein, partial [Myxococcota bacterium]